MKSGDRGWLILLSFVAIWDIRAAKYRKVETLSEAYWAAVNHPVRRWPTIAVWVYLTMHLHHLIPERFDPLRQIGNRL